MTFRIALAGAQGTGKSTLARAIVVRLRAAKTQNVQLCTSVGGEISESGLVTGAAAGAETVLTFARLQLERELGATGEIQVFDRCLLDTLAYARILGCLSRDEFRDLQRATLDSCRRVAQLLWLRVTSDYPVKNAQDETPEFRRAIDKAIGELALEHSLSLTACAITPESLDGVVDRVIEQFIRALPSTFPSSACPHESGATCRSG